ncbi:MAG: Zn-dependent protease with chaperone function [bacterium]|jgi:Zn-dependent protease with chaperone function
MIKVLLPLLAIGAIIYYLFHKLFGKNKSTKKIASTIFTSTISPSDYRVRGEILSLRISIGALALSMFFLSSITFGIFFLFILYGFISIYFHQTQLLGSAIQITPTQLPKIYLAAETAANRLSMPLPDIFVVQSPELNAYAIGVFGRKSVVLHSALVEALNHNELISVIGHEFSHIKCGHTQWIILTSGQSAIRIPLVSYLIQGIFLSWSRKAEYTCDRGGLIACQDIQAAVGALSKITVGEKLYQELDFQQISQQTKNFKQNQFSKFTEIFSTHPFVMNRLQALIEFHKSKKYTDIIK